MKYRYAFLFFIAGFILQSTVINHLSFIGMTPNIVLCLVTMLPFLYEGNHGLVFGVFFGLLQDLSFSLIIGPAAVSYFIVALIMSAIRHYLYRDSIINIFFASIIGTILYYSINWSIIAVFGGTYDFIYVLKGLPVLLIYHIILMIAFYLLVGRRSIRHPQDRYYKSNKIVF